MFGLIVKLLETPQEQGGVAACLTAASQEIWHRLAPSGKAFLAE